MQLALDSRRFTLRALMGFTGIIGVALGLIAAGDTSDWKGVLLIGLGARILAVLVVGATVGLLVGSFTRALVSAAISVLVADLPWIVFVFILFSVGSNDVSDVVFNPILIPCLMACPAAAAKNRMRALTIGISLSIAVPSIAAASLLVWLSSSNGLGLAQFLGLCIAAISVATGVVGTVLARVIIEVGSDVVNRRRIKQTSLKNIPEEGRASPENPAFVWRVSR